MNRNVQNSLLVAGLMFLLYAAGIVADGLPGEYILTQRWRDLFAGYSALSNPAYMTEVQHPMVRGAFSPTLHGAFRLWELGYTQPITEKQSAGVTWFGEDDGDVAMTGFDSQGRLVTGANTLSNQNHFIIASYAINIWKELSVGINIAGAYQTNFGESDYGVGVDLGITYRLLRHPIFGDHTPGIFIQNVISPEIGTISKSLYSKNIKFSWIMKFWEERIESGFDIDIKDILAKQDEFVSGLLAGGSFEEGVKKIEYDVNFRLGGWIMKMFQAYFQIGSQYWGLSAGMNMPSVNNGRQLSAIYQYMMLTDNGNIENSHTVYVRAELGKHKKMISAERKSRNAKFLPNKLYNKGRRLYYNEKYWEAFFVFGELVARYPFFFKNDWAMCFRGRCLEYLDMRTQSVDIFEKAKEKYPKSDIVPRADLGIMRLQYREENHDAVRQQYDLLNRKDVPDSLRYHALYLMGQTDMRLKRPQPAIAKFDRIPESHPDYIFAQHSRAICFILELNLEESMACLENCLQANVTTKQQEEIYNRSCVFLGYLFFEEKTLSKAVTALRMTSKSSYYYEDALLGIAWTGLMARQWTDLEEASNTLIQLTNKTSLKCEGLLLKAYAFLMMKKHSEALDVLEKASELAADLSYPQIDSLAEARREYQRNRISYDFVSREANELSLTLDTTIINMRSDSLHASQKKAIGKLKLFEKYADEFERHSFFARGNDQIKADIEYAHAVVQNIVNRRQEIGVKQDLMEEQADIDDEIEKLKKEMKDLEKEE